MAKKKSRKSRAVVGGTSGAPQPTPTPPAPTGDIPPESMRTPPATHDELHRWLCTHLRLSSPRAAMLEGHSAPFEYLCHSFFDPRGPETTGGAPAHDSSPRDLVLWANRGGGKTFLGAVATMLDLVFKTGIEIRILGGSAEQSRRMLEHLRNLFDPTTSEALAAMVDGPITGGRIRLRNGSRVEILAQSHTSVRGTRVQILRCDEVDLFKRDIWKAAQFVTRSKTCGGFHVAGRVECLSTMHKPHGIMHEIVAECEKGSRRLFKWGVLDVLERCDDRYNCTDARPEALRRSGSALPIAADIAPTPCPLLDECQGRAKQTQDPGGHFSIADAISQKRRASLGDWQSEMLCIRPRRSANVLADFDPVLHVGRWHFDGHVLTPAPGGEGAHLTRPATESQGFLCGMDFGIRGDGVILWAVHGRDEALYFLDESIGPGLTIHQHADLILSGNLFGAQRERRPAWPVPQWIGCDPAGNNQDHHGKSCVGTLRERGLATRFSRGPLQEGLEYVRARLRPADGPPPRLFIHERCTRLIEAMTRYHYPEDKPESLVPVKDGFDHPVDALRYLVRCVQMQGPARRGRYAG